MKLIKWERHRNFSRAVNARMEKAIRIADESEANNKHGACLYQGSRLLSVGINSFRNDPKNLSSEHIKSHASVHAEVAATRSFQIVPRTTLYVARVNAYGMWMGSEPCPECLEYLTWMTNVKEVYHT